MFFRLRFIGEKVEEEASSEKGERETCVLLMILFLGELMMNRTRGKNQVDEPGRNLFLT